MTDLIALRKKIDDSGLKVCKIAEKLNISTTAYYNKINGDVEFKSREIKTLKDLLNLTGDEVLSIFLS